MDRPADLPHVIEWRCPPAYAGAALVVLRSLPTRAEEGRGSNGETNWTSVRHCIPHGVDAWRLTQGVWRPLAELPAAWREWLQEQGRRRLARLKLHA